MFFHINTAARLYIMYAKRATHPLPPSFAKGRLDKNIIVVYNVIYINIL